MIEFDFLMSLNIRKDIIRMSYDAKVAHITSALSQCDYLGILLMNKGIVPQEFAFLLGKPFGAQAYYSLFHKCGWIKDDLSNYGTLDPNWRYIIQKEHPLIQYIDESMGNSLGVACGIAQAGKRVFVNMSDASFQEGTVWEAVLYAGAQRLSNIIMAIDFNNMQALGTLNEICTLNPLDKKLRSFGWNVIKVNGHDLDKMNALLPCFCTETSNKPTALIFETIKGKGISFMEGRKDWHYRTLTFEDYLKAIKELSL